MVSAFMQLRQRRGFGCHCLQFALFRLWGFGWQGKDAQTNTAPGASEALCRLARYKIRDTFG